MHCITTNQHDDMFQGVVDQLCHDPINDFDGQEAIIMDEIKDEKIYDSTSSNGSGQSSLISPNENKNDSLQSHLSNGANAWQGDDTTTTPHQQ